MIHFCRSRLEPESKLMKRSMLNTDLKSQNDGNNKEKECKGKQKRPVVHVMNLIKDSTCKTFLFMVHF